MEVELEQAILGAILVDNKRIDRVEGFLKKEHFSEPLHERTYETMLILQGEGRVITPMTLSAIMRRDGALASLGMDYFGVLAEAAPAITNIVELARIVVDTATLRSLYHVGQDICARTTSTSITITPATQVEEAEKAIYRIATTSQHGSGAINFAESMQRTVELAERAQARGGRISGLQTGFADIDKMLSGLQPSDLLILAGRPGMGKTALATNMAFNTARMFASDVEQGIEVPRGAPVLFFSLEMAAQQLSARILSEQTEIEMWKIRNGNFKESEWEKFILTMQDLSALPLYIDDTGGISIAQIASRARRMKREKNIGCVMIDHIQLVQGSGRGENRVQELTEISKGLKVLAKELDIPVVALSQLSRSVDSRDDKRPVLSDLRESGSIEQDADVVMFVYREEYYLASREPAIGTPEHGKWLERCELVHRRADVLVEKHRHGATGKIELFFDAQFTRFSNLAERE